MWRMVSEYCSKEEAGENVCGVNTVPCKEQNVKMKIA